MEIRIYRYAENRLIRIGLTNVATGHYVRSRYEPGKFELSMPAAAPFALEFLPDSLVLIDRDYWGIITGRKISSGSDNTISITGSELTELLSRRVIVPDNAVTENKPMGYDSVSGSTEAVIKHYVSRHAAAPDNPARKLPMLEIAPNEERGTSDDAYTARYSGLMDTLSIIAKRANLGLHIRVDERTGKMVFDVSAQLDRTAGQSSNRPLILEVSRHNLESSAYTEEYGQSNNTFYCSRSGDEFAWETLTQTYFSGDEEPKGMNRRERSLSISVYDEGNQYEQLEKNARKEMMNYTPARALTCVMARTMVYGKDYRIGDVATVIDRVAGMQADMEITAVDTSCTAESTSYVATFGTPQLSVFQKINREMRR